MLLVQSETPAAATASETLCVCDSRHFAYNQSSDEADEGHAIPQNDLAQSIAPRNHPRPP
jgi:hypothetical protein